MEAVILTFHIIACLGLIFIVLLQTGRGAEIGAVFGGSSQTLFGSTGGTTFLGKMTTLAAVVFMLTCLGLTYMSGQPNTESIMDKVPVKEEPALPEAKPVQTPAPAVKDVPSTATEAPKPATTTQSQTTDSVKTKEATAAPSPQKDSVKKEESGTAPAASQNAADSQGGKAPGGSN